MFAPETNDSAICSPRHIHAGYSSLSVREATIRQAKRGREFSQAGWTFVDLEFAS